MRRCASVGGTRITLDQQQPSLCVVPMRDNEQRHESERRRRLQPRDQMRGDDARDSGSKRDLIRNVKGNRRRDEEENVPSLCPRIKTWVSSAVYSRSSAKSSAKTQQKVRLRR